MAEKKSSSAFAEAAWIRELANILQDTGLTEIELEKNDVKLRVARLLSHPPATSAAVVEPVTIAPASPQHAASEGSHHGQQASPKPVEGAIKSPMVGTVYLAPSPGADTFVKVGDTVSEGQTVMIVEAMKTMNPITAPASGIVTSILVDDSQPVEFDEPLMVIN